VSPLSPHIAAMRRADFYPGAPADVRLVQTHISYVFLAGDEVYKVKKPVHFAFLDFSTLERRRHFCTEEVRLNRRLAGDVYRGVLAIVRRGDGFALAPADAPEAVDYAVHMRRLPAARSLAALLDSGAATPALLERLAAHLAAFHAAAEDGAAMAAGGDPARIAALLARDGAEVASLHGETISAADDAAILAWCAAALRRHDALLRRRQGEGRIRDGHGDLRAEHVYCLADGALVIVDCLEFDAAFRQRDVAADLAFLAMDLDAHARPDLAARLVAAYATAAADPALPELIPFYACQRAYIRGKVDSLTARATEVEPAARAAARDSARRLFALAYRYTWSDARALVVVTGLSGSGKSTLAAALAARTGLAHVNSDRTRKALAGLAATARGGRDLYSARRSAATYRALYAAAAAELAAGRGVIIDATFQRRVDRDAARAVAAAAGAPLLFVECRADAAEIRRRLAARCARGDDASDADWAVYARQRLHYQSYGADEPHIAIDTAREDALAVVEQALRGTTVA
jgi:hypothetical protein